MRRRSYQRNDAGTPPQHGGAPPPHAIRRLDKEPACIRNLRLSSAGLRRESLHWQRTATCPARAIAPATRIGICQVALAQRTPAVRELKRQFALHSDTPGSRCTKTCGTSPALKVNVRCIVDDWRRVVEHAHEGGGEAAQARQGGALIAIPQQRFGTMRICIRSMTLVETVRRARKASFACQVVLDAVAIGARAFSIDGLAASRRSIIAKVDHHSG